MSPIHCVLHTGPLKTTCSILLRHGPRTLRLGGDAVSVHHSKRASGSSHVCGVDALVQELLQGEHLAAAAALVGAAGAGGPSHLQRALVGGA